MMNLLLSVPVATICRVLAILSSSTSASLSGKTDHERQGETRNVLNKCTEILHHTLCRNCPAGSGITDFLSITNTSEQFEGSESNMTEQLNWKSEGLDIRILLLKNKLFFSRIFQKGKNNIKKKNSCFGDVNRLGDLQGDCLNAEGQ